MAWSKSLNNKFAKIQPKEEEKKKDSSFYDDYKARSSENTSSVKFTPSVKAKEGGSMGNTAPSKQSGGSSKKTAPTTVLGNNTKYFSGFKSYQDRKKTGNVFTPSTVLGKHDNRFSRQNIESMKSKQWRGSYGVMPAPTRVTDGNNATSEKKPGFGKWLVDNMMNGVGQFNRSIASTVDFILPTAKDFGGDSTIDRIIDYYKGDSDRLAAKAARTNEVKGGHWKTAGNLMSSTIAAVPNAVIAMMTGGASSGAGIVESTAGAGLGKTLFTSAQQLVKNPMFWTSFAQTAGNSYDEAKADGASDLEATATAMISSMINAGVEIGGGIEAIPNEARSIKNWVKGMLDEGKEEVIQGIVEQATKKAVYDRNKKTLSMSDENAVINPKRAAQEFMGGAVVGGVLGGTQMGAGAAINNYNDTVNTGREFKDMGEVQSVIDTGKASDNKTSAYRYAGRLQQKQDRGADLSDWNVGRQYQKNVKAIDAENALANTYEDFMNVPVNMHDKLYTPQGQEINGRYTTENNRYSPIEYDDEGNAYVHIKENQGIFVGIDEAEYNKTARDFMYEKYKNTTLPLSDYNLVYVNKTGIQKYNYSGVEYDTDIKRAKSKAVTELHNLLEASEYIGSSNDKKDHSFAKYGFEYYKTKFMVDGQMFEGIIDIGVSEKGATFYGMSNVKRVPPAGVSSALLSDVTPYVKRGNSINNIISENGQNVNGKVDISLNGDTSIPETLSHEYAHVMRRLAPEQFKTYEDYVNSVVRLNDMIPYESSAQSEETAAIAAEKLKPTAEQIEKVINGDYTIADKAIDAIDKVSAKIKDKFGKTQALRFGGEITNEQLYTARKLWEDAVRAAAENKGRVSNNENVTKYSPIEYDNDGKAYVRIENNVLDGVPRNQWSKAVSKWLNQNIQGREFTAQSDGDVIKATRKLTNEYGRGSQHQELSDEQYNAKMNLAGNIDEAITISNNRYSASDNRNANGELKHGNFAKYGWDYRVFNFEYNGKRYTGKLNVAKNDNGHFAYDVTNIKETEPHSGSHHNGEDTRVGGSVSFNNSIHNSDKNVKYSLKENAYTEGKVSQLYENTMQKDMFTDSFKSEAERRKSEFMYEGITNKETYEAAQADITICGDSEVLSKLSMKNSGWTANDTAKSLALMAKYQTEGNAEKAVDVASMLREKMTQAGQAVQALKIINKLTPEGQFIDFTRQADKMVDNQIEKHPAKEKIRNELREAEKRDRQRNNNEVRSNTSEKDKVLDKWNIKHLSDNDMREVSEGLKGLSSLNDKNDLIDLILKQSKERKTASHAIVRKALEGQEIEFLKDTAVMQMFGKISDKMPVTFAQKASTYQAISHLLNARTMARNIVSNTVFNTVDRVSTDIGSIVDCLMGVFSGKRSVGVDRGLFEKGRFRASADRAVKQYLDIALAVNHEADSSKYNLSSARRTFKGRVGGGLERAMSYGLQVTDEWSKGGIEYNVRKSLERLKKSGFTSEEIDSIAEFEAKYRTFQDNTKLSQVLGGLKDTLNVIGVGDTKAKGRLKTHEFGLGDLVQKYTQVPGALITRSIEYSPLGYCKALYHIGQTANNVRKGANFGAQAQRNIALSLGRAMTGTGLIALFAGLSKLGIFTGERGDEDEKLKAMENAEGISNTQLNLSALSRLITGGAAAGRQNGDVLTSLGFLEPLNTLMAMGNAIAEQGNVKNPVDWTKAAGAKTFDQIMDMSTMSTIRSISNTLQYGGGGTDVAIGVIADSAAGFVPGPVRQIGGFFDTVQRNPYNEADNTARAKERFKATLPKVRENVAAKITPFGEEKTTSSGNRLLDFANNFFAPGNINIYQSTDISEELYRLSETSADVLPHVPSKSFTVDKVQFKPRGKEYEKYSRLVGTITAQKMRDIINSDEYGNMSDDDRITALSEAAREGEKEAKAKFAEEKTSAESIPKFRMTEPLALTAKKAEAQEKQKQAEQVTSCIQTVADDLAAAVPDKAEDYSAESLREFNIRSAKIDGKSYDIKGDILTKVTEAATDEYYANIEKLFDNDINIEDVIGYGTYQTRNTRYAKI